MRRIFTLSKGFCLRAEDGTVTLLNPDGTEVKAFRKGQLAFLACLTKNYGEVVSVENLISAIYGEESGHTREDIANTRNNLTKGDGEALSALKDAVKQKGSGYIFTGELVEADSKQTISFLRQPAVREQLEEIFTVEQRFGKNLLKWIEERHTNGSDLVGYDMDEQPVSRIFFSGYAGTGLLQPDHSAREQRADQQTFYFQELFQILLRDPTFKMKLLLTEPYSVGANDAIKFGKLGNDRFSQSESAVFTSSAAAIKQLLDDRNSAFAQAGSRLMIRFTELAFPYALFGIEYKDDFKRRGFRNHIKVDLYSAYINQTKSRPCFVVFQDSDPDLYSHFKNEFENVVEKNSTDYGSYSDEQKKNWVIDWKAFENNGIPAETKRPFIIRGGSIEKFLKTERRQYFVGDLKQPQSLPFLRMGDIEIGSTLYQGEDERSNYDSAHYHERSAEILYVLAGRYGIKIHPGKTQIIAGCGDFVVIPPHTPYEGEALEKGTRILFVKLGGNDKVTISS